MALQGTLLADFSSFTTAVEQSLIKLRAFEEGSNKVGSALNRMADSFSGRKIVQDATLMAEVFTRAGGAAAFTEKELARMAATGTEAVAKLRALGKDIPPGIQAIADATRNASQATGGWLPILHAMGQSFVVRIAEGVLLRDAIRGIITSIKDMASALPEIALQGAAVADVSENFQQLAANAGLVGDALIGALRSGTHSTISDFELMKTASQDLAAGMNLTAAQFSTLSQGAFALAQATGGDVKTALDTMNDAMLTGRTRALALLTGKIDLEAAEKKYAASLGLSRDNLTEAGKLEAARVAILDAVGAATARLGAQTDGLDERVAQAQTVWANFKEELGKTIAQSAVLEAGMSGLKQALIETFGGSTKTLIDAVAKGVDEAAIAMVQFGKAGVSAAGFIVKEWYAVEKIVGDVVQLFEIATLANEKASLAQAKLYGALTTGDTSRKFAADAAAFQKAIDDTTASILKRGEALQEADKLQAGVDTTTAKYIATLEGVRAKMVAARDAGTGLASSLTAEVAAQQQAAAATENHQKKLDELAKQSDKQIAAAKKFADAMDELNSAGDGLQGTIDTIDGSIVAAIQNYLKAGVSQAALAEAYGLTAAQVKAVASAMTEEQAALKLEAAAVADSQKNWASYNDLKASLSLSTTEKMKADLDLWVASEIAAHQKAKTDTADFYQWVSAQESLIGKKQEQNLLLQDKNSKESFLKRKVDAEDHYRFILDHMDQYTQKDRDEAHKRMEIAREEWRNWREVSDSALDDTINKVHTLAGEYISAAEAHDRLLRGNTQEVNAANFYSDQVGYGPKATGGQANTIQGVSKADLLPLLRQGFSLQNAMAIVQGHFDPAMWQGEKGPRVPGFSGGVENFSGGMALVGERGPELLNLPRGSNVIPFDRGTGGGNVSVVIQAGAVVLHGQLNDRQTINDMVNVLGDGIIQKLKGQGWRPPMSARR